MKVLSILRNIARVVAFVTVGLVVLLCAVVVVLYSPWAQGMLREAFVNKYGHTTDGTHIALDSFSLRFPLELNAGGLSVWQDSDTLIAAGTLSARVSLLPLFVGKVDIPSAVATAARYRLGGPARTMFMTIAAASISLSDAGVTLFDLALSLSAGLFIGGRLAMPLNPVPAFSAGP